MRKRLISVLSAVSVASASCLSLASRPANADDLLWDLGLPVRKRRTRCSSGQSDTGARRARFRCRHRLRPRFADLRQGPAYRPADWSQRGRQRAAPCRRSPAMGGRWRSAACSACCVVRIRSSSSMSATHAIRPSSARTIRRTHPSPTSSRRSSNGGFLVTFMGGGNGAHPGRVVEYDAGLNFVQAWPTTPPDDGFNPHGISIDEAHNLMVTSDFICPLRTLHVHGGEHGARARQRPGLGSRAPRHHPDHRRRRPGAVRPGRWKFS